jgi:restriction system protein
MVTAKRAWLTRSGRYGERDAWALETGVTPGGFGEVPDLSASSALADVRALVDQTYPDMKPQARANYSAQLWTLVGRIQVGDWVVLPLKTTSQIAIGEVSGEYEYRKDSQDKQHHHVRTVKWVRTDIPRLAIQQDLLYSLGAFSTYCEVARNEAALRIAAIASSGKDPGTKIAVTPIKSPKMPEGDPGVDPVDGGEVDIEQYSRDRITAIVQEKFSGHPMQELVAALLRAQGFTCKTGAVGTDGGVDILAGSGPLGMDGPKLVVQVKSEQSPVSDPVVTQLLGSVSKHGSAQGLLVAWGGVTPQARKALLDNYFRVRMWDASDLVDRVTRYYSQLPEEIRADLPLKQVWIAVEESP